MYPLSFSNIFYMNQFSKLEKIVIIIVIGFLIVAYTFYPLFSMGSIIPLDKNNKRAEFILTLADLYAKRANLSETPEIVLTENPAAPFAMRAVFIRPVIAIPTILMDSKLFSDDDLRAILAHETAHIVGWDSYRFWNHFTENWLRQKELRADVLGARYSSCEVMHSLFKNHYELALKGWKSGTHPHPNDRIKATGTCS